MFVFDKKLELFGPGKLTTDITLKDLAPSERKLVGNGHLQLLPDRDQAGRAVIAALPDHGNLGALVSSVVYLVLRKSERTALRQEVITKIQACESEPYLSNDPVVS
jgi:hypothetical protein